ncbi:MFS family permease [Marmoricola sp. URHA0025 HA25]
MPQVTAARNAVVVSFFLNGATFATWVARLPEIRHRLDLTNGELGTVLLAGSIASIIGLTGAGKLIERRGAATTVRLGVVVDTVGVVAIALGAVVLDSAVAVAGGLFVWGLGMGLWDVAMNVEGAGVEHRLERTIMPRFHAMFSLGSVAGAVLGALTAKVGVPMLVVLPTVASLILASVLSTTGAFLPRDLEALEHAPRGSIRAAWTERRTLMIGLMVLALTLTEGAANDWLAIGLVDGYGVAAWLGVAGFALFVTAMTVGRMLGTNLLDRFGRARTLWGTMSLASLGVLLVVFGSHPALVVPGIVLWGIGASLGFPVGMSAAADDEARAPARVGVVSTIGYVAFLSGPPTLGFIGDHVGTLHALLVISALLLPAALLVPAARKPTGVDSVSGR